MPGKCQVTAGGSLYPGSLCVLCLHLCWRKAISPTETALVAAVSGGEDTGLFSFLHVLFVIFTVNMNDLVITIKC